MNDLTLKAGGILEAVRWHDREGDQPARSELIDVTELAHAYLFNHVELEETVTLGDIFRLLEAAPLLKEVFLRDFANELCVEAAKGALPANDANPDDALAYLELYQFWNLHTGNATYGDIHRLGVHAIGVPSSVDRPDMGITAGQRIEWSISLAPLRALLGLPVRVNTEVRIFEDDHNAKGYAKQLQLAKNPYVTLGQIIHSVLWELSFYGAPAQREEMADELKSRMDSVQDGTAELVSHDDLFAELGIEHPMTKGVEAMFDSTGRYTVSQIRRALRSLDDDVIVGQALVSAMGDDVIIKEEYRNMGAREFRTALRDTAE